ncbi:hypothetical protein V462_22590 [Pantoea ananatis 15320]|jgi:hypothetical protein|nr:hypothetical protein L585_17085 [Pantoea ananatis BRT175]PKC29963.1 hypothetical protein V462_22590 [Pantoea ananatis 15320]PKC40905.1 hypothetical protein V461_21375 [Pantoea ananatis BRT98]CCF09353.1 hypothetical protein PANA5342_1960 [Pantoea ananatis LMG 5342]
MLAAARFSRGEGIRFYESGGFSMNAPNNIDSQA